MAKRKNDGGERPDMIGMMARLMPQSVPEEIRRFVASRVIGNQEIMEALHKASRAGKNVDRKTQELIFSEIDKGIDEFFEIKKKENAKKGRKGKKPGSAVEELLRNMFGAGNVPDDVLSEIASGQGLRIKDSDEDGNKIAGIIFINAGGPSTESAVKERVKVEKPHLYNVIFHNDDETPMGFVVEMLVNVFDMEREAAAKLMMDIHTSGKGIAGTYIKSIAEMKVMMVRRCSEEAHYPLLVTMEAE